MASIEERITKIVSDHLGFDPKQVKPESKLVDDLKADSLDVVELAMAIEEEFEVEIPDEEGGKFRTVADLTAYIRKYMVADGE